MKSWVVTDPEHLGGSPRVRDTRIPVTLILESLTAGMRVAEIVDAYPSLTEESVHGALAELKLTMTPDLESLLDEGLKDLDKSKTTDELRRPH